LNLETQRVSIEGNILKARVVPTDRRITGACFPTSEQADIHSRDRTLAYTFFGGGLEYPQQGQVEEDGYAAHASQNMQSRCIDGAVGRGILATIASMVKRGVT